MKKTNPVVKVTATKLRGKSRRIDMVYNGNDSKEDLVFLFNEIIQDCKERIKDLNNEKEEN